MSDSVTKIVVENELKQTGFDKALRETEKLNKALLQTLNNITDIGDMLGALTDQIKAIGKLKNPLNKFIPRPEAAPAASSMRFAKDGQLLGYTHDPRFGSDPNIDKHLAIVRSIERERRDNLEAQTKRLKEMSEIEKETNRIKAFQQVLAKQRLALNERILAEQKYRDADYRKLANERDFLKGSKKRNMDLKSDYLQYKLDHMDQFTPLRTQKRYQMGSQISSAGQFFQGQGTIGKILGGIIEPLGKALYSPGLGLAALFKNASEGIATFVKSTLDASTQMEAIKTNLGVVYGSQTEANAAFGNIADYATKSPFGVEQTTEMAVLLKQSGVYATDLMDTLKMIGDTAGGNVDKMKRIANNYAQITSIGKASMLDMRQFAYAGIPIYKAVSKELGVTQERLRQMISEGKVTSDIIEKVFKDLTGVNGLFENATEKGAQTYKARIQNLQDAAQLYKAQIGDRLLNVGIRNQEAYGGPGVVSKAIGALENALIKGQHIELLKNIEADVSAIEQRDSEIAEIERLIEYAELRGDDDTKEILEKKLDKLIEATDVDSERAVYGTLYDEKKYRNDNLGLDSKYKGKTEKELQALIQKNLEAMNKITTANSEYNTNFGEQDFLNQVDTIRDLLLNQPELMGRSLEELRQMRKENDLIMSGPHVAALYTPEFRAAFDQNQAIDTFIKQFPDLAGKSMVEITEIIKEKVKAAGDAAQGMDPEYRARKEQFYWDEIQHLKTQVSLLDQVEEFQEEEIKAHKEITNQVEQQKALTITQKASSAPKSLLSDISNIKQEIASSEKAQKEERKSLEARWKETIDTLASIDDKIDESGHVNFAGLSLEDFNNLNAKGAFEGESLTAELTESYKKLTEDAKSANNKELKDNFTRVIREIGDRMPGASFSTTREALVRLEEIFTKGTYNEQIQNFSDYFIKLIDAIEASNISEDMKTLLKEYAASGKNTYTSQDKAGELVLPGETYYPLYQRIESSALGIPLEQISTSTKTNLDYFHNFLSKKNISAGVFESIGNISTIQGLLKYRGLGKKDGDKVFQVDWDKTLDSVERFAISLDTSTETLNAWRNGLENERSTLIKLISSDIFTPESMNVDGFGNFKGSKEYGKWYLNDLGDLNHQTAVNAFGEALKTKDGKDVKLEGDQFVLADDRTVKVADENLVVTGNIYELLKKYLKDLDDKRSRADTAYAQKTAADNLIGGEFLTAEILSQGAYGASEKFLKSRGEIINKVSKVLEANPRYFEEQYDTAINNTLKNHPNKYGSETDRTSKFQNKNLLDLSKETVIASKEKKDAVDLYFDTLTDLMIEAAAYAETETFQATLAMNETSRNRQKQNSAYAFEAREKGWISTSEHSRRDLLSAAGMDPSIADFSVAGNIEAFEDNKGKAALEVYLKELAQLQDSLTDIGKTLASDIFTTAFESMGSSLADVLKKTKDWKEAGIDLAKSLGGVLTNTLKLIGPTLTECGLRIAAAGATSGQWGIFWGGLGLAAAGGFASALGSFTNSMMEDSKNKDSKSEAERQAQKAQDLKDQLAALLEQARKDALYYENNLRHKTAIGLNKEFSLKSVNDAIISPSGDVITTHPEDYLIATKTPDRLLNNKQPITNVSFKVINNSPDVRVRQEKQRNALGETEVVAIIESVVTDFIAGPKGDTAFSARQARNTGSISVM